MAVWGRQAKQQVEACGEAAPHMAGPSPKHWLIGEEHGTQAWGLLANGRMDGGVRVRQICGPCGEALTVCCGIGC